MIALAVASIATAAARSSPSTTCGGMATRWSGPPHAHHRGTTSPNCPGSVPSAPPWGCTTRRWSTACGPRSTPPPSVARRCATAARWARTTRLTSSDAHQSQWTIIDFATAVAIGAIIGRTAIASTQSFITGAAAVLTLIAVHRLASLLRFNAVFRKLLDHRVRILVEHGQLRRGQLRRCGLTDNDLFAHLRQTGVRRLDDLRMCSTKPKAASPSCGRTVIPTPKSSRPDLTAPSAFTGNSPDEGGRESVDLPTVTDPGVAAVSGCADL